MKSVMSDASSYISLNPTPDDIWSACLMVTPSYPLPGVTIGGVFRGSSVETPKATGGSSPVAVGIGSPWGSQTG